MASESSSDASLRTCSTAVSWRSSPRLHHHPRLPECRSKASSSGAEAVAIATAIAEGQDLDPSSPSRRAERYVRGRAGRLTLLDHPSVALVAVSAAQGDTPAPAAPPRVEGPPFRAGPEE